MKFAESGDEMAWAIHTGRQAFNYCCLKVLAEMAADEQERGIAPSGPRRRILWLFSGISMARSCELDTRSDAQTNEGFLRGFLLGVNDDLMTVGEMPITLSDIWPLTAEWRAHIDNLMARRA
jgi:hypothetical protein